MAKKKNEKKVKKKDLKKQDEIIAEEVPIEILETPQHTPEAFVGLEEFNNLLMLVGEIVGKRNLDNERMRKVLVELRSHGHGSHDHPHTHSGFVSMAEFKKMGDVVSQTSAADKALLTKVNGLFSRIERIESALDEPTAVEVADEGEAEEAIESEEVIVEAQEGEARSFSRIISDTWQNWRNRYKEWAAKPFRAPKSDE